MISWTNLQLFTGLLNNTRILLLGVWYDSTAVLSFTMYISTKKFPLCSTLIDLLINHLSMLRIFLTFYLKSSSALQVTPSRNGSEKYS